MATISEKRFDEIGERYGRYSSWAIWDAADIRNTSIISRCVGELRIDVIMVGVNASADVSGHWWKNFHHGRNDHKLRLAFNESRFRGAYMTDIIKSVFTVKAADLMRDLRSKPAVIAPHLAAFKTEMSYIGADKFSLFLVFGRDAQFLFEGHLAADFQNFIPVEHFACYRTTESWLRDLWQVIDTNESRRLPD